MGTLKLINPHDLNTAELLQFCQSLGLKFESIDGDKLTITGRLDLINDDIRQAITTARDELLVLVYCTTHSIEYVAHVGIEQYDELNRLINALCDTIPHTVEQRQAMMNAGAAMRPMDIPHCIEHFKRCMWHVERGTYWRFRARFV